MFPLLEEKKELLKLYHDVHCFWSRCFGFRDFPSPKITGGLGLVALCVEPRDSWIGTEVVM